MLSIKAEKTMYTKPLEFQITHKYKATKTNQLTPYYQNIIYIK